MTSFIPTFNQDDLNEVLCICELDSKSVSYSDIVFSESDLSTPKESLIEVLISCPGFIYTPKLESMTWHCICVNDSYWTVSNNMNFRLLEIRPATGPSPALHTDLSLLHFHKLVWVGERISTCFPENKFTHRAGETLWHLVMSACLKYPHILSWAESKSPSNQILACVILLTSYGREIKTDIKAKLKSHQPSNQWQGLTKQLSLHISYVTTSSVSKGTCTLALFWLQGYVLRTSRYFEK